MFKFSTLIFGFKYAVTIVFILVYTEGFWLKSDIFIYFINKKIVCYFFKLAWTRLMNNPYQNSSKSCLNATNNWWNISDVSGILLTCHHHGRNTHSCKKSTHKIKKIQHPRKKQALHRLFIPAMTAIAMAQMAAWYFSWQSPCWFCCHLCLFLVFACT